MIDVSELIGLSLGHFRDFALSSFRDGLVDRYPNPACGLDCSAPFAAREAGVQRPIMANDLTQQLLDLNQKLLVSIIGGDWKTYESLCDASITCFEPEARGQLAIGMPFHKYFFDLPGSPQKPAKNVTMSQPHVRLMGDSAAVLCYVRLTQSLDGAGEVHIGRVEETRVWQKIGGEWKHVHFHRSGNT